MKKKEIRKLARQKINAGASRQQALEELQQETQKPAEDLAKIVRFIPPLEIRRQYKTAQTILIIALGLTVLFKMAAGLSIVMEHGISWSPVIFLIPLINVVLTYGVATYRGEYYIIVIIFAILGLFNGLQNTNVAPFDPLILIDLGIAGLLTGLGFYLNAKMVAKTQTVKEEYTNQEGQALLRNKIEFVD